MFPYRIVIEWSESEGLYVATVPALAGCSAHGASAEAATHEGIVAGTALLENMRENGLPLPASDLRDPPARVA